MNEDNFPGKYSKRLIFSIIWSILTILVSIYLAIEYSEFGALLVILTLAPLAILMLHKLDIFSQRTLRDNSYVKEKAFRASVNTEKSYKEVKALRKRAKLVSARNARILERVDKLNKKVELGFIEIAADNSSSAAQIEAQESTAHQSTENRLQGEWESFLSEFSRISHFNSIQHPTLSSVQQTEISQVLEAFDISTVFTFGQDQLNAFDRHLNQLEITNPRALSLAAPSDNSPFIVLSDFENLIRLRNEVIEELLTLNAAFIVTTPLSSTQLESIGFSRIPTQSVLRSIELVCPQELIGEVESTTAD